MTTSQPKIIGPASDPSSWKEASRSHRAVSPHSPLLTHLEILIKGLYFISALTKLIGINDMPVQADEEDISMWSAVTSFFNMQIIIHIYCQEFKCVANMTDLYPAFVTST